MNASTTRLGFNLQTFASSAGFGTPLGGTFFYLSTNPSQVGTSTGILTVTPTSTPTTTRASVGTSTAPVGAGNAGNADRIRIHLAVSLFVVPLAALLL